MFDGLEMFQVSGASDYQVDYDVIKASAPGKQKVSPLDCLLYTSPSPRDVSLSRMPSSA